MNTRERFHSVMNFEPFDRLPIIEWAPWWGQTIERWHGEGLDENLNGLEINEHLGLDLHVWNWPKAVKPSSPVLERGKGMCPTMQDYRRNQEHLYPRPAIDQSAWEALARRQGSGEAGLWLGLDGFFWLPRRLMGIEQHLYGFYDQPELIHRINSDLSDWLLEVIDEVCAICRPDVASFEEDMSYNHGPMLSRDLFEEFLKPYYEKVMPSLTDRGIITIVD